MHLFQKSMCFLYINVCLHSSVQLCVIIKKYIYGHINKIICLYLCTKKYVDNYYIIYIQIICVYFFTYTFSMQCENPMPVHKKCVDKIKKKKTYGKNFETSHFENTNFKKYIFNFFLKSNVEENENPIF